MKTDDDSGYLLDKAKRDARQTTLDQYKLIEELVNKLVEANDLLKEASTYDFNSNLGARIKMFLSEQDK